ncbi:MAG: cupin domain-containing protein [Luminiphilus sp.]|jgi:quercetin dioxygenase-like cupin family protein|nr:cupin domain-containing protein [Luminiphilus sp.]MDG1461632.1 cupin domain-containing protein [Luminiphilus sp.]
MNTLQRMLIGLGQCLLFMGGLLVTVTVVADDTMAAMKSITTEVLVKSNTSWNGRPLPSYSSGEPEISVVRVTIPSGSALPMHTHPFATAGFLLQGRLKVKTPGGETLEVSPGDGVIELVNQPHGGVSVGTEDAVILVVYAGIKGQPVTELVIE